MLAQLLIAFFCVIAMVVMALILFRSIWWPALLQFAAERQILIFSVREGAAAAITHFGEFERLVMSWQGHYLDAQWNVIQGKPGENGNPPAAPGHWIDKLLPGGLHWKGWIGMQVYYYHFQWLSIRQGKLGSAEQTARGYESIVVQGELQDLLISRDEVLNFILVKQDLYGITFQDTEDKDMIPLSFIALLTGQIVNPYKALFFTEQWLEQVTNFLRRYIKEYVGKNTFIDLVTDAKNNTQGESVEILGYLSPAVSTILKYIEDQWGFRINHLNLVNFRTSGDRGKAYEQAAATEYVEAQRAKGIVKIAEAEKTRLKLLGEGEAARLHAVKEEAIQGGDMAELILGLETYQKIGEAGNTIVLGGNQPVQMLLDSTRKPKPVQPATTSRNRKEE